MDTEILRIEALRESVKLALVAAGGEKPLTPSQIVRAADKFAEFLSKA